MLLLELATTSLQNAGSTGPTCQPYSLYQHQVSRDNKILSALCASSVISVFPCYPVYFAAPWRSFTSISPSSGSRA